MANIFGTRNGDSLFGTDLADLIEGRDGDDYIDGRLGADIMRGGRGNDVFVVDDAGDRVEEFANDGTDEVRSTIDYILGANVENLTLLGNAVGGTGNSLNNRITGNAADNVIRGGGGSDVFTGGAGNDTYVIEAVTTVSKKGGLTFSGMDLVIEAAGGGNDTVYSNASYSMGAEIENVILYGGHELSAFGNALDNQITGNGARNFIQGGAGNDRIDGGAGADFMDGGAGNDTFVVDNVGDLIQESFTGGTDRVLSSISYQLNNSELEHLTLQGSAAIDGVGNFRDNQLNGNSGANRLDGREGNDVLDGKGGNDVLTGGLGSDVFVFSTALGEGNVDRILQFETAGDRIALDDSVFAGIAPGALAPEAFAIGAAAQDADDRIVYNRETGALMFDADGVGGADAILIATLEPALDLSAANFVAF